MAVVFTPEQEQVIKLHNRNILVSAAAGSGKTAVLVERIVQMICDETHPVDIDRLLVVTFTNAAAAQMREKISQAIAARLEDNPASLHLQRQAALVHNAQITTIDSFCLFIIRNNFNDIGLDPSFRVADEGELKLLKKETLAALLEDKFAETEEGKKADFLHCVECYAANGREERLEEHLLALYEFAMSYPWPEEWLRERMEDYRIETKEELYKTEWIGFAQKSVKAVGAGIAGLYGEALRLSDQPDGPYMYAKLLEREKEALEKALGAADFETLGQRLSGLSFDRLPSKKDDTVSPQKREQAKLFRKQAKDRIEILIKKYFKTPLSLAMEQGLYCQRALRELLSLCLAFKARLDEKKREKNILDFSDMEHLALNILLEKDEDGVRATKTAMEYRSYFAEVLIDEYQDSNLVQEYLLRAVSGEEEGNFNRFMVGDVKQSIYKFRLARPELFMEKYHTYSREESQCQRIDLRKNFRSRREVLENVNYVFSQIMGEDLGGICYDDEAALYPGAVYPDNPDCAAELLLVEKPSGEAAEEMTGKELEAYAVAAKIRRLMERFQVTDKETGRLRPCRYRDIVVLLRTNSGWDEVFKEVFAKQGIPAHTTAKTGYFSASEIQNVMQFLRVLDNPLQDIPLFGALTSVFGGFTEEETAKIRLCAKGEKLYDALRACGEEGEEEALREKAVRFLGRITAYREKTVYLPVRKLLREIFTDYGYLNYVTALPAGEQRAANVEMLLEKAEAYEKTSYYGLFHFIRYVEQLEKYDVDYGEANILDENADVVRIMSIHKSKGLEFPVTIVAGLSKRFNMQDTAKALIVDADMGIGTDYVEPELRITNKTLRKSVIAEKIRLDNLAEELRVLYVAMTRAKEKLILTGMIENPEKKFGELAYIRNRKEWELDYGLLTQAGTYLDYLLPALIRHSAFEKLDQFPEQEKRAVLKQEEPAFAVRLVSLEELRAEEIAELVESAGRENKLSALKDAGVYRDEEKLEAMTKRFAYRYPYENLRNLYTKTTVSELKLAAMEEKEEGCACLFEEERVVPYIPAFRRGKDKISGTVRGSAFHKVMELLKLPLFFADNEVLPREKLEKVLKEHLLELVSEGRLSEEYYEAVSRKKVSDFLSCRLAKRMYDADQKGKLYREQPFVYKIAAKRLNEAFPEGETVLIQGIVDVFFLEEDGLVLADYKTDVISSEEELVKRYQTQLDYYSEALENVWHMPVKERILYSFCLERTIDCGKTGVRQ